MQSQLAIKWDASARPFESTLLCNPHMARRGAGIHYMSAARQQVLRIDPARGSAAGQVDSASTFPAKDTSKDRSPTWSPASDLYTNG